MAAAFCTFGTAEAASDANVVGGASASIVGVGCKSTFATGATFEADNELLCWLLTGAAAEVDAAGDDTAGDDAAFSSVFPPFGKNIIVFFCLVSFAVA